MQEQHAGGHCASRIGRGLLLRWCIGRGRLRLDDLQPGRLAIDRRPLQHAAGQVQRHGDGLVGIQSISSLPTNARKSPLPSVAS